LVEFLKVVFIDLYTKSVLHAERGFLVRELPVELLVDEAEYGLTGYG
jgi:hypothetical protein